MKRAVFRPLWARFWMSPRFYIAVLCMVLVIAPFRFSVQERLVDNILSLYNHTVNGVGLYTFAFCILPAFPFASVYAEDETNGVLPQWSIRGGIWRYAAAFYAMAMLSGFLTVLVGFWCLFGFLALCGVPLLGEIPAGYGPYAVFMEYNLPLVYLLFDTVDWAIGGAVVAGAGALVGTYTRNHLAAVAGPLMLYMLIVRLNSGVPYDGIWRYFHISNLLEINYADDPVTGMLVKCIYLLLWGGLCGLLTIRKIERRQKNA